MTFDPSSADVMCGSSQGSLFPSPIGIHQMYVDTVSILQKIPHVRYIELTTYLIHIEMYILESILFLYTAIYASGTFNLKNV